MRGMPIRVLDSMRDALRGRSRDTVLLALALLALTWACLAVWRATELGWLRLAGAAAGGLLLAWSGLGLLLTLNLHTGPRRPGDTLATGVILALGGIAGAGGGIWFALPWVAAAATALGGLGVILLLHGLGLLPRSQLMLGVSMALGGGAILLLAVLQPGTIVLLPPLLLLGLGMAGLHHRRYQLAGFVLGCYLAGLGCIGWLIAPEMAGGGLLGGGLAMAGSGMLFLLRRSDREARRAMLAEVEQALEEGHPSAALEAANRVMRRAQQDGMLLEDERLWAAKAHALLRHRQYDRAIIYFSMALEIAPQDEQLWYDKGVLYRRLGEWGGAARCFAQATELDYAFPEAWLALGQARERLQELEPAAEAFQTGLELGCDPAPAYLGLGRVLAGQGQVREALKALEQAISLEPENPAPYMARGDIYLSLEDFERADEMGYSRAVQYQRGLKEGWWKLAQVYRLQRKPELEQMALTRILESDPENARALWERADLLYQDGSLSEAMGDLHRLLALNPGNQKARRFKSLILEKLGEKGRS